MNIDKIFKEMKAKMKEVNHRGNQGALLIKKKNGKHAIIYVRGEDAVINAAEAIASIGISEDIVKDIIDDDKEMMDDVIMAGMEEAVAVAIHKSNMSPSEKVRAIKVVARILSDI